MKHIAAALIAALLLQGCSYYQLNAGSATAPAAGAIAPGTSVSGGSLQVQGGGGSAAAVLIAIGILAGVAASQPAPPPAPLLAPERRVNEQDCTRPIADPAANLKCR
jgi:hypothetical protein